MTLNGILRACCLNFIAVLVLLSVFLPCQSQHEPVLQQVIIISRHGSRGFLTKHHKTFVEGSDSKLTVRGKDQMYRAGQYVRHRYNGTLANFLNPEYNTSEVYTRSSDYERTLTSAQSFLLGLYPPRKQVQKTTNPAKLYEAPYNIQQVPIHTVQVVHDQLLRGWLRCPTFQNKISEFYESDAFKKKEKDNFAFLKFLEGITEIDNISLKDFYNVYDFIHLHRAYGHLYLNITEIQWLKVVDLADWLEYHKYNKGMIGSMGAGLLTNEILQNFQKTKNSMRKAKLLYYSAHYPTIVSLFSVLGVNEANKTLQTIPYYASLVFLELFKRQNNEYFVKFAFRNGLQNDTGKDTFQYYTIPGCGSMLCPLDTFVDLFKSLQVHDTKSWCNECSNVDLDTCQLGQPYKRKMAMTAVGGFFVGVFVTVLLVIVFTGIWHYCLKKKLYDRPRRGLPDLEHRSAGAI